MSRLSDLSATGGDQMNSTTPETGTGFPVRDELASRRLRRAHGFQMARLAREFGVSMEQVEDVYIDREKRQVVTGPPADGT